jgi:hypothetical protein
MSHRQPAAFRLAMAATIALWFALIAVVIMVGGI